MSNFSIFDKSELGLLINPFLPGAVDHITPIKYQAITPDIFALLFRTTGQASEDHYFVVLEFDESMTDIYVAAHIIEQWSGGAIQTFLMPDETDPLEEADLQQLRAITNEPYHAVMANIERPTGLGYWSNSIVILPGEELLDKLAGLNKKQLKMVHEFIREHSEDKGFGSVPTANTSNYAISVWPKPDGGLELFYN